MSLSADPEYSRQGSGKAVTSICLECLLNSFALIEHQVPVSLLSYRKLRRSVGMFEPRLELRFFFFRRAIGKNGVPSPWRRGVTGAEQIVPIVRLVVMVAEDAGEEQVLRNDRSIRGRAGERDCVSVWPALIPSMALYTGM